MDQLIEYIPGSERYRESLRLRDEILRQPLGLGMPLDIAEQEVRFRHFGWLIEASSDMRLAACLMLVPNGPGEWQLRQMAVCADLQRRGYGSLLVLAVEQRLRSEGFSGLIFLHARLVALGFYKNLGFVERGQTFTEVGLPHIRMEKVIEELIQSASPQ